MYIIENRNLFRINRLAMLYLPWLLRLVARLRKPQKKLLIIKTDAIGDYVLFRNFISAVQASAAYAGYKIDVLGNPAWKDAALTYDAAYVNEFIFTTADRLYDQPAKTLKLGWQLFKNKYDTVLVPAYSRTLINDALAALTGARRITGFESNYERIYKRFKKKTDKFYSRLLPLPESIYFEFDRNRYFFEQVLGEKLLIDGPHIRVKSTERNGIIIFPGAGTVKRGWEREKFLDLIERIMAKTSQPIYITGGPAETAIAKYLADNLPGTNITDLTAKTTLPELIELIGSATLLISNETSAVHIAAATKTPSVCILGGGHFGRFAPYPAHMPFRPVCVYEMMECFNCNWNCIYKTPPNAPQPCVSKIGFEDVWGAVASLVIS